MKIERKRLVLLSLLIFGGIRIDDHTLMIAVTEKRTKEEIDQLISLCHE